MKEKKILYYMHIVYNRVIQMCLDVVNYDTYNQIHTYSAIDSLCIWEKCIMEKVYTKHIS